MPEEPRRIERHGHVRKGLGRGRLRYVRHADVGSDARPAIYQGHWSA
jgi:hypothetical protein